MRQTPAQRAQAGLRCPQCGCCHFWTTNTERLRNGRIRRRKSCRHCGRKVVTLERITTPSDHQI